MKELEGIKAFLFDLDGTIYLGKELIGDVINTLKDLRERGIKIVYLTNNSSKTDGEYLKKLKMLNLYEEGDYFYSSLDGSIDYIKSNRPNAKVYAVATDAVKEEIAKNGVNVVLDALSDTADTLLLTFDTTFNYEKMTKANRLLNLGAFYMASHPDKTCPTEDIFVPDLGSFIEFFKASSGREPQVIIGKPYCSMAESITKMLGLKKEQICMVGDRLNTDILFGINAGFKTLLVMSGETTEEMWKKSGINPTLVLPDVNSIKYFL